MLCTGGVCDGRKKKLLLGLCCVLVLLGGMLVILLLTDEKEDGRGQEEDAGIHMLADLDPEEVERVSVTNRDGDYSIVKKEGEWQITGFEAYVLNERQIRYRGKKSDIFGR